MNPLNYGLAEVSKALVALIGFIGYVLAIYLTFDPNLITSIQLLVPAAVAVIVVFAAKNHSPDDLQKAVSGLVAAALTVVNYFHTLNASETNKILVAAGALVTIVAVYWKANTTAGTPRT